MPVIDNIDRHTFEIASAATQVASFSWGLSQTWLKVSATNPSQQRRQRQWRADGALEHGRVHRTSGSTGIGSPAMAGGIFAIRRAHFYEIGSYDGGMELWGGENLEMAFRVWGCGGRLEVVPCSRVAHIFRPKPPCVRKLVPPKVRGRSSRESTSSAHSTAQPWTRSTTHSELASQPLTQN
jgi:polypeptide N-acetylgalactosaminyltransferase